MSEMKQTSGPLFAARGSMLLGPALAEDAAMEDIDPRVWLSRYTPAQLHQRTMSYLAVMTLALVGCRVRVVETFPDAEDADVAAIEIELPR